MNGTELRTEVLVIGTGPGGAVTACTLAEAGREVLLIEEGTDHTANPPVPFGIEEMSRMYRNGGLTAALGKPKVSYVEASCVGGGSEVNAGVYHRLPPQVLEDWARRFALCEFTESELAAHFDAIERDCGLIPPDPNPPPQSRILEKGAQALGWASVETSRLLSGKNERASMSRTFLPRALAAGAKLRTGLRARRIVRENGDWIVHCGGDTPVTLRAKTVFICAGAIQTPLLLRSSGLSPTAGRTLALHPTVKATARFADPVNSATPSVAGHQIKEFSPDLSIGCSVSSRPMLALSLLDHVARGEPLARVLEDWERLSIFYAMIRGPSTGSVRPFFLGGDPWVGYALGTAAMRGIADGLRKLSQALFAAGATEVIPSVAGLGPFRSPKDLDAIPETISRKTTRLVTFHLAASAPMGEDPKRSATDSFGRVHGHAGLHVGDASLLCEAPGVNPQGTVMALARRNARRFLEGALALACAIGLNACATPATRPVPRGPNVILISIDTLRADRIGFEGRPGLKTPNLDRIANEGVAFTRAFSNASITTASHMSMFTGLIPSLHRVSNPPNDLRVGDARSDELDPRIFTLPQILSAAGYHTASFIYSRDYFLDPSMGFGRGFDELYPFGLDTRAGSERVAEWIRKNRDKPFFLFVHSKRPHMPYVFKERVPETSPPYRGPVPSYESELGKNALPRRKYLEPLPGIIPDEADFIATIGKKSTTDLARVEWLYDRAVELTDSYLGTLFAELESAGLKDRTILIVTSDHGEEFREHGGLSHSNLNRECTRVPLLIRVPGKRGIRIDATVQGADLLPTVTDLLGLKTPPRLSGASLRPWIEGRRSGPVHERIFAQNRFIYSGHITAVTEGRWKLIVTEERDRQLYDLEADPLERVNRASSEPALVHSLGIRLKELDFETYFGEEGR